MICVTFLKKLIEPDPGRKATFTRMKVSSIQGTEMIEIERVGLPRDLPVGEGAPEVKFYFAPKEGELSAPALGTDVDLIVPQDGRGEWEWVIVEGRFVLIARV